MSNSALYRKEKLAIINWLIEYFPAAFFKHTNEIKPLQIGIFEEILDFYDRLDTPPFSKKALREALHFYSQSPAYLNAQKEGAIRVDLYGNEMDVVSKEQAHYAQKRYAERYASKKKTTPATSSES